MSGGPGNVVEGVVRGITEFSEAAWRGAQDVRYDGVAGAGGLVGGVVTGSLGLVTNIVEGARNTPDTAADIISGTERVRGRHGTAAEPGRALETYIKEKPNNVVGGLVTGGAAVGRGLYEGTSALVTTPFKGDIIKGTGEGLMQFTLKTASGTLDLVDAVTGGLANTQNVVRNGYHAPSHGLGSFPPDDFVPRAIPVGAINVRHSYARRGHRYYDKPFEPDEEEECSAPTYRPDDDDDDNESADAFPTGGLLPPPPPGDAKGPGMRASGTTMFGHHDEMENSMRLPAPPAPAPPANPALRGTGTTFFGDQAPAAGPVPPPPPAVPSLKGTGTVLFG